MEIFIGAIVSVITQLIRKYISPLGNAVVIGTVLALSLAGAIAYYAITLNPILWEQVAQIFGIAGGFYAFVWKQLEE